LQNFALKTPKRVLQSFTILNVDLGQRSPPCSRKKEILHANSFQMARFCPPRARISPAGGTVFLRLRRHLSRTPAQAPF
jgi:hypothetical protein